MCMPATRGWPRPSPEPSIEDAAMTDSTDPFADEPTPAGSVTVSRTTLLVALGLLGATAALLVVARSLQQTRPTTSSDTFVMGDDWKVSLQHLADAVTLRLNGI